MRTTFAVAFLSATLAAKQTMATLVRGQDWAFRMNEAPAECKAYSAQPWNCAAQNMWHPLRSHNAEYYVHDSYQNNDGDGRQTFADASAFCESEALNKVQADGSTIQSYLVSIHDEVERNFVISLQANNRHGFWVGVDGRDHDLYDTGTKQQEGFKKYLDGSDVDYTSWAAGEPNSARYGTKSGDMVDQWMDECIFQGLNKGNPSLWNDANCLKRKRVVCKRALPKPNKVATCNGLPDPAECRNYYDAKCGASLKSPDDYFNFAHEQSAGEQDGPYWSSVCPLKCNACNQTTTTMVSTTTTDATTSTTAGETSTTTDAPTTTTTFRSTTTTVQTTTTTFRSTTTTFQTTTTTFITTTTTPVPYTTTSTTGVPTTTTTEAPRTTTTQDSGVCNTRGWSDVTLNEETGISCCYKYNSKPRLSFMAAEQSCNEIADDYAQVSQVVSHLASPYTNEINEMLVYLRNQKPGKANAETAWIGANLFNANGTVEWVNDYFKIYNGNYAKGSHGSEMNVTDKYPEYSSGTDSGPGDPGFVANGGASAADVRKAKFFPTNGMFYRGEPSGKDMNFGNRGNAEECVMVGSDKFRTKFVGDNFWNDGKCGVKRSYFCEFCYKMVTTTTAEPTSSTTQITTTTTDIPTTSTTEVPSTTTTDLTTSTTVVPSTTTTELTTSTTEAPLTTTTTTFLTTTSTAAPDCESILCSTDCGELYDKKKDMRNWESHCGWSSNTRSCKVGGRTSPKELAQGQCDGETTTKKPTTTPGSDNTCAEIYCSSDCGLEGGEGIGAECREYITGTSGPCKEYKCGWSRKQDRCLTYPARTNEKEANGAFGPKC